MPTSMKPIAIFAASLVGLVDGGVEISISLARGRHLCGRTFRMWLVMQTTST